MQPKPSGRQIIVILCLVFAAVFSACVLANVVPKAGVMTRTLDSLEKSQKTILEFSGATLSASVALSALPNDFASPVANLFAEMNKYTAFILAMVLFEKIIVVNGVRFLLTWGIPTACGLYIITQFTRKHAVRLVASKIAVLCFAVILVVPLSTGVVRSVGEEYMAYVERTIHETEENTAVIEAANEGEENQTLFERLDAAFAHAVDGISNLVGNFKNLAKRCATSIAILILNTFFAPLLVFVFVRWLLKELFSLSLPAPRFRSGDAEGNHGAGTGDSADGRKEALTK